MSLAREDEDFRAVLNDLSVAELSKLVHATVSFMDRKERLRLVYQAIAVMDAPEWLQLVKDHTPGQYVICVRNTGINEDLSVDGIPPRGA